MTNPPVEEKVSTPKSSKLPIIFGLFLFIFVFYFYYQSNSARDAVNNREAFRSLEKITKDFDRSFEQLKSAIKYSGLLFDETAMTVKDIDGEIKNLNSDFDTEFKKPSYSTKSLRSYFNKINELEKQRDYLEEKNNPIDKVLIEDETELTKLKNKIYKNKNKLDVYFSEQNSKELDVHKSKLLMAYIAEQKMDLDILKVEARAKSNRNYLTKSGKSELSYLLENLFKSIKHKKTEAPNDICNTGNHPYKVDKNKLLVCLIEFKEKTHSYLKVNLTDVFKMENESFDGLIFSDSKGQIISAGSNHSSIGFSNMNSVFAKISKENLDIGMFGKFTSNNATENKTSSDYTPSVSVYTDMTFSGTEYRIFIYPFTMSEELEIGNEKSFYLAGLVKKNKLGSLSNSNNFKKTGYIISFACVFAFVVALVRLMISEKNIGFGWLFRYLCITSSVAFIVLFISGILGFISYELAKNRKQVEGVNNVSIIENRLKDDVKEVLKQMKKHNSIYDDKKLKEGIDIERVFATSISDKGLVKYNKDDDNIAAEGGCSNKYKNYKKTAYVSKASGSEEIVIPLIRTMFNANKDGDLCLPDIEYAEKTSGTDVLNISHREYFKSTVSGENQKNNFAPGSEFYIERLLNLTDGTRGTTIAVPWSNNSIVGADITMPSLTINSQLSEDYQFAIVERISGSVLFHSRDNLSVTENFYTELDGNENVTHIIQYGLEDYNKENFYAKGHYHGKAYNFIISGSGIDDWAIVVFYPVDTINTYVEDIYTYISISMFLILVFVVAIMHLLTLIAKNTKLFGDEKNIHSINKHSLVVLLIASLSSLTLLEISQLHPVSLLIGFFVLALIVRFVSNMAEGKIILTLIFLVAVIAYQVVVASAIGYVHKGVGNYYQLIENSNLIAAENRKNKTAGLYFPSRKIASEKITVEGESLTSNSDKLNSLPESLSYSHIRNHFNIQYIGKGLQYEKIEIVRWRILGFFLFFLVIAVVAWSYFYKKILIPKLYGTQRFLDYLEKLHNHYSKKEISLPQDSLILNYDESSLITINTFKNKLPTSCYVVKDEKPIFSVYINESEKFKDLYITRVDSLFYDINKRKMFFKQLKKLVKLVIENPTHRLNLFIRDMTIKSVFKREFLGSGNSEDIHMSDHEVFSWSWLLSKFEVVVPADMYEDISNNYIIKECSAFKELKYLSDKLTNNKSEAAHTKDIMTLSRRPEYSENRFMLLHANALYRFKWIKCSNSEKLELFHTANGIKPNPRNKSVIEDLVMKGFIKLDHKKRLIISNHSFQIFIKNAEISELFVAMQKQAEKGTWQNYKWIVSIGLFAVLGWLFLTASDIFDLMLTTLAGLSTLLISASNSASLFKNTFGK